MIKKIEKVIKIETKEEIESLKFAIDSLQTVIKVNGSLLAETNHKILRLEEKVKNLEGNSK